MNYYDSHHPYLPPDKYYRLFSEDNKTFLHKYGNEIRYLLDSYDGEIAFMDHHIGKLFDKLKKLNIYDNTMIIITSDHGEYFGEHDLLIHGQELYEQVIKIPLIIKYPLASSRKGIYTNKVCLVDLMPTVLNFLQLKRPDDISKGDLLTISSPVIAETYMHQQQFIDTFVTKHIKDKKFLVKNELTRELKVLFEGNYKLIKEYKNKSSGRDLLYDLQNDPLEEHNLINEMPQQVSKMEQQLDLIFSKIEKKPGSDVPVTINKDVLENLKALGYIE